MVGTAEAGAKVKIFIDGVKVGTTKADKKGEWTFKTKKLSDDDYNFKVKAQKGGKTKKSEKEKIVVDTDAELPVITGYTDDTGTKGDLLTGDPTLKLTGTAEARAWIKVYDGAEVLGFAVANHNGSWSFATAALTEGAHSFTVKARDKAGNTSSASAALSVTIDTTPPSAPSIIGFSEDTGTTGDGLTTDEDLTLTGTAEANATIEVFDDTESLGTVVADGSGDWSLATGLLSVGAHSFTAVATDPAGNTGPASTALPVTIARVVFDLTTLAPSQGFIIQGDAGGIQNDVSGDRAGYSVSSAGDVNGDGFDDLMVGANGGDDGGTGSGEAYVVFGSGSGFGTYDAVTSRQVLDLTDLTPAEGFIIQGDEGNDWAGWSVSSAGDINDDGFDDMIVGANGGDDGGNLAGEAYVVFGSGSGFGSPDGAGRQVIDLTSLSASQGLVIRGDVGGDQAGRSVSSAGDVNGDGFDDLFVGAPSGDDGGCNAGEAYVLFGSAFGGSTATVITDGTAAAEILIGGAGGDQLSGGGGADVIRSGAGDDVLEVADLTFKVIDGGSGTDFLVFGGADETIDFTTLADNTIVGIEALYTFGSGNDTIVMGALDVFHFSDTPSSYFTGADSHNNLIVVGDDGDTLDHVSFSPGGGAPDYTWVADDAGVNLDGSGDGDFDFYNLVRDGDTLASIAVAEDMTVLLGP